jgi:hypothetical protein
LYTRLGLIKISVKVIRKESEGFVNLRQTFATIIEAELKEKLFVDLQTTKYQGFSTKLNSTERRAWKAFENVCCNFLGNEKMENYCETVQKQI